jgi:MoaA/NifB/PqqE/SkfB family radical SAM enzyme
MEYTKQVGEGHKVQRLYVHWDITSVCEYKCSYCYAREEYKDKWMRPGNWTKQQKVIEELSKATLPVFLGLLGGEPTSHHKYWELVEKVRESVLTHEDSRLYITTNGYKDSEFFKKHTDSTGKEYILFSWHPEYNENGYDTVTYLLKHLIMYNKGYKLKTNIMLHPNKKYWGMTHNIIKRLRQQKTTEIHPHFIYSTPHKPVKYSKEFYEEFRYLSEYDNKEFLFYKDGVEEAYTDIEVFEKKLNKFKGWNCYNNNYEIGLNCDVNQFCIEDKHAITTDYFKNITEIKPVKCPHNFCSCDGLLKIKKER